LETLGVRTVRSDLVPEGARIVAASPEARQAGYAGGWFSPQDEGSMLVSRFVAPRPGETVIDACAGSGGKTIHLAALMEHRGRLVACDVVPAKLDGLRRQCTRAGVTMVEPTLLDVTDAALLRRALPAGADRVLVDAPCSGLGAIRRRPEIKWRLLPEHLPALAARQHRILEGAAQAVRPGGVLVYAVCTIEPEEGPEVVSRFIDAHEEFEPAPIAEWPRPGARHPGISERGDPAEPPVSGFLYPHRHGTDGFFVAALRRRTS
jgi:16S rRNA (cytosine967-C5)-methyltransferase